MVNLSCVFNLITGRFPLSVSNTYTYTRLSINEDIREINLFKGRFVIVIMDFFTNYNSF